ncbi:MAG: type II secretion system F family protein [Chloroflexi bacterium]|nr:type II secretion system F family protein [Chloroflexota bacterium]
MISSIALLVAVAIILAILSVFVGFYRLSKPAGEIDDRLQGMLQREAVAVKQPRGKRFAGFADKVSLGQRMGGQVALELTRADVALTVNEYGLVRLGAAVVGLLVGWLILGNLLFGALFAILGMQLPVFWLHSRRSKRQHGFQTQLVDVLTMLVSGLRAGVGLIQAMDLVRREMPAPASVEFGRVVQENSLGVGLGEALDHLQERMPSDDLAMVITVVKIQAEVGGNLANVLDGVITTIRERVQIFQEIRSLTSQQRLTGYMLAALPFIVAGLIMMVNPGYMMPLFSMAWIWLPALAVVMIVIGFIVIGKIVDIKV